MWLSVIIIVLAGCKNNQSRWEQELSGSDWQLYLDDNAEWEHDSIFLPPVNLADLPINLPSCSWESLHGEAYKSVTVPGTVEGYYWSLPDSTGDIRGDYIGVSWWSNTFEVPSNLEGKRLIIGFQSVNLRAEVFVNNKLVGYDVIGNTPFDVEITDAVNFDDINYLDIRITDIGGTFSWDDERALAWGDNLIPSVHGFGGITGKVNLYATDDIYIDDIYVQNQPNPEEVKVITSIENTENNELAGTVNLKITEFNNPKKVIYTDNKSLTFKEGSNKTEFFVSASGIQPWNVKDPHLYQAEITFTSEDDSVSDIKNQRFGFRFMDIGEKNGDKRLYLNGDRVFLLAAMTRGFWPKMGMFPIPGMAERDINQVINLGYNMIMYHRAIGQPESMDLCDEMGILTYEEPGGYQSLPYPPTELAQKWRKEKLRRMILRDRSRPSLTNWNLDDWSYNEPNEWDYENINMVHELDPSRIVTFNCIQPPVDSIRPQNPFQLHMLPFDSTHYFDGWYDPYHFAAQDGYVDEYYNNPRYYARYMMDPDRNTLGDSADVVPKDQIYFLGEEGAFGTQLNLERIKNDLDELGADGWMDQEYLNWYESYDKFLDAAKLRNAFPSVEDLTMKMGHNLHYFHGRIIENVRMMNVADGYVLNGWSGGQTNTDIVDTYRHPTGDPAILPYYAQPLYVAVKLRNKVVPTSTIPVADVFLINEEDLSGKHILNLKLTNPDGEQVFEKTFNTEILGGEEFGQLLVEGVILPEVVQNGYYKLNATLTDQNGEEMATGFDELFAVNNTIQIGTDDIQIIDASGTVQEFLTSRSDQISASTTESNKGNSSLIIVAEDDFTTADFDIILKKVEKGSKLIILENAESWISKLPVEQLEIQSRFGRPTRSIRGRQFVGTSPYFSDLPQATAMSWEYQAFYRNGGSGIPISPTGLNVIVGVGALNSGNIGIALCELPYGEGKVILSTLDILPNLLENRPDCAVAKRLLINLINSN
ncbi:MAG TPA: hypothetical protein VEP89_18555 [Draconibacterium sp.]|nr:hypothetical protein [Draconibacterium sp.]